MPIRPSLSRQLCENCHVPQKPDGNWYFCPTLNRFVSQKFDRAAHKPCSDFIVFSKEEK